MTARRSTCSRLPRRGTRFGRRAGSASCRISASTTRRRSTFSSFPGGFGTRSLLEDATVLRWIGGRAAEAEHTTSVCTGALLLAATGLLSGRRATTHRGALELLAGLDPTIDVRSDARVVFDGVVTSAGVSAGIDMALAMVGRLHGREVADETANYMEYRRDTEGVVDG